MKWEIEKRKQGMEIWANSKTNAIFIGECYHCEEKGKEPTTLLR